MANAVGTCPVCGLDKRLTPARQLVASHVVNGQKCKGSGASPTKVVQSASGQATSAPARQPAPQSLHDPGEDWAGRCRVCQRRLLVTERDGRIVDHQHAGRRCSGSGHLPAAGSVRTRLPTGTTGQGAWAGAAPSEEDALEKGKRHRLAWMLGGVLVLLVAGLLTSQAVTSHRADEAKARAKARTIARCDQIYLKSLDYVTSSGVSAGGKEWARNTLDAWPADLNCSSTQDWLEEMASGVVDARLAAQATPTRATAPSSADCERRIAALMDLDIDEQSRRDNVDAVRIECDMPPLQQDPFWQEAWQRHQRGK